MLKQLITKLYLKYGQPDLVALTRIQLAGVQPETDFDEVETENKRAIAAEARTILNSETYKLANNNVMARLLYHIQTQAPDTESIMYDRFSINGASMIREELEQLAENPLEDEGDFDEHSIL